MGTKVVRLIIKNKNMKLKVIKADAPLQSLTLDLKEASDGSYLCSTTGYSFIDGLEEIDAISKSNGKEFYDMHLFTIDIGNDLTWIQEVELIDD